jgi:hypothetical protein
MIGHLKSAFESEDQRKTLKFKDQREEEDNDRVPVKPSHSMASKGLGFGQ